MLARTFMEYLCLGMSSTRHLLISLCARYLQPKLLRPSVKPNPIPCLVAAQRRQYTASGKVFKSRGVGVGSRTTSTVDSTVRAMATSSQALELEVVEVSTERPSSPSCGLCQGWILQHVWLRVLALRSAKPARTMKCKNFHPRNCCGFAAPVCCSYAGR